MNMKENIKNTLIDTVNDVLFENQKILGITSGDISPELDNKLTSKLTELADILTEILKNQRRV